MVVGAGPIGIEMAQCFALFGAAVTVLDVADKVLPREDPAAAARVAAALAADGVALELGVAGLSFSSAPGAGGAAVVTAAFTRAGGAAAEVSCEALLVATGRAPNVERIGLEVSPSHPFS